MEILLYVGKVSLFWILFYACYQLFLRKQTFFVWNRVYLLGSLLASFLLPFVVYPESAPEMPVMYTVSAATYSVTNYQPEQVSIFTWLNASIFFYILAVGRRALVFFNHIRQLSQYIKAGEIVELEDCKVVLIDSNEVGSFSFLQWIVVNRNDYELHFDAILRHEMVHTSQRHSYDILFVEILSMIFWFNPVLKGYKHSLQEVHEYLADEAAPNREVYAKFLLAYSLNAPIAALTNHFFKSSQLKGRIQMIYKNRTSKWLRSSYLLAFSFMGTVALLIAGCERMNKDNSEIPAIETDSTEAIKLNRESQKNEQTQPQPVDDKVYTVVEQQPKFPGGDQAMYRFLGENIKYPEAAVSANVTGKVFLSFVVTDKGDIQDVNILKGIGHGCDEEAVRVVSKFPKWKPGKQDGKPVNVMYTLPIMFQMEEEKKTAKAENTIHKKAIISKKNDDRSAFYIQLNGQATEKVRGENNLNPDVQPLVIVDGVILEERGNLSKLDPENIESISVLKDHSSTSVYGKKGENGVVLVTSKKRSLQDLKN